MDFDLTERQSFFRDRVREFIETHVRPRVGDYKKQIDAGDRWQPIQLIEELKPLARQAGLWNLFMPPGGALQHVDESFAFEGEQLTNLEYALCAEEMGRILWSAQAGAVLTVLGGGVTLVSQNSLEEVAAPLGAFGVIIIALGFGFLVSAFLAYVLTRRFGLMNDPAPTPESHG